MKKMILPVLVVLMAGAFRGNAQSLHNTAWKMYVSSLNDTLTLHIGNDSSYVTTGTGDVVVRSTCRISKDTVTLQDFDGQYICPNQPGVYTFIIKDEKLVLKLVSDDCEGRNAAINGIAWARVKPKE
jgi:hypothetical protein